MLEGLDDIDWAALGHAYGPATDVPGQLRALLAPEPEAREKALWELYGNIWHQGTVYEATAHVVPFLVELLAQPAVSGRHEIALLLSHIADGTSYRDVHRDYVYSKEEQADPAFQAALEEELGWVRAAREAVVAGFATYRACLADRDPALRASIAYLLGNLEEPAAAALPLLRAAAGDGDDIVRASSLIALGSAAVLSGTRDCDILRDLEEARESDPAPLARLAAALAILLAAGKTVSQPAIDTALDALAAPDSLREAWARLPWRDGGIEDDIGRYLSVSAAEPEAVIDRLEPRLEDVGGYAALNIAYSMLRLAFRGEPPAEGAASSKFDSLPELRQRVLRTLAYSDKAWTLNADLDGMLRALGLPDTREKLKRYVSGTAPSRRRWLN